MNTDPILTEKNQRQPTEKPKTEKTPEKKTDEKKKRRSGEALAADYEQRAMRARWKDVIRAVEVTHRAIALIHEAAALCATRCPKEREALLVIANELTKVPARGLPVALQESR